MFVVVKREMSSLTSTSSSSSSSSSSAPTSASASVSVSAYSTRLGSSRRQKKPESIQKIQLYIGQIFINNQNVNEKKTADDITSIGLPSIQIIINPNCICIYELPRIIYSRAEWVSLSIASLGPRGRIAFKSSNVVCAALLTHLPPPLVCTEYLSVEHLPALAEKALLLLLFLFCSVLFYSDLLLCKHNVP